MHAPGRTEPAAALAAAHHLNLAHGLALHGAALGRGRPTRSTRSRSTCTTCAAATAEAAPRQIDGVANRLFLGPMLDGALPGRPARDTRTSPTGRSSSDGDPRPSTPPIDLLGVNYYAPTLVRARSEGCRGSTVRRRTPDHPDNLHDRRRWETAGAERAPTCSGSLWVDYEDVEFLALPGPYTAMGSPVDPTGLTELLARLHRTIPAAADDHRERGLPRRPGRGGRS